MVLSGQVAAETRVRGKTFEVVDYTMLHDKFGTYMRIGEPFVLR